jgi:hypothetical protein
MRKNILKKVLLAIVLAAIIALLLTVKSYAATSISISTSKSSVAPGESFTVTVSAVGAGPVNTTVSNGSGGKRDFLDNSSYSFTCTAGSSGSVTIYASGTLGDYATGDEANRSASKTVSIVQPNKNTGGNSNGGSSNGGNTTRKPNTNNSTKPTETKEEKKSTDSTLSSLSIAEGAITPEFNKDVKEYAITVPNEVTKLNITATPTDSKATVSVTEYEELKEGENIITISVTAEDGTTKTDYVIKATRQRKELALEKLIIKYTNQNGELVEVPLTPEFTSNIFEYSIETLEYWVKSLDIEALANIEGATIEISGADSLKEGENVITITVKNKITMEPQEEGAEPTEQEETKTYTIKFNKNAEPTIIGKISNWFKGIFGGVSTWYANNQEKAVFGALMFCIVALIGLSIYIIVDYKKYQDLLGKIGKLNNLNNNEIKATSEVENITVNEEPNNIEDIYKDRKKEIETNSKKIEEDQNKEDRPKGGRHF